MSILSVASTISIGQFGEQIDFIGKANLWVDDDYSDRTLALAKEIIFSAYKNTAPSQLEIIAYDSNLSGIVAPFTLLQNNTENVLKVLSSERELTDYLNFLRLHIQGVNNVLQGKYDSLLDFRKIVRQPVESYKLVVLATDLFGIDGAIKENLNTLLHVGPRVGVSFLIVSTTVSADDFLMQKCTIVDPKRNRSAIQVNDIISFSEQFSSEIERAVVDPIVFEDIQQINQMWTHESSDGISFAIGKYGTNTVEITLGDEKNQRHNALITGAVGQGKSNLISVIIHSLCQRYSPKELELYLLDFKEGVTLQSFSNLRHDHYLPHARTLGLESDVDFGIAVLEHLFAQYEKRMRTFKAAGVQNIKQYRNATGKVVPRTLLIVDEFQMMFESRETAKVAVALLSKCSRLFRAAGIHIILASQTIASGIELGKDSDIFAQTPIRIAHKNSIRESEATLGLGNTAASDLRMGQAIVNLDYGALSQNRKVTIALADNSKLELLQKNWWENSRSYSAPPYVFEGDKAARITSCLSDLIARRFDSSSIPSVFIGETISVNGLPQSLDLPREAGRNVAIIGAGTSVSALEDTDRSLNAAIGIVQSAALSLALQNAQGNAQFVLLSLLDEASAQNNNMQMFLSAMQDLGFYVEQLTKEDYSLRIDELATNLDKRTEHDDSIYFIGLALDKLNSMSQSFQKICKEGSAYGLHVIGWWQKMSRFEEHVGFGNSTYFDMKVILRVDARDIQRSLGIFDNWESRANRALVVDSSYLEKPKAILPYAPLSVEDMREITSRL